MTPGALSNHHFQLGKTIRLGTADLRTYLRTEFLNEHATSMFGRDKAQA